MSLNLPYPVGLICHFFDIAVLLACKNAIKIHLFFLGFYSAALVNKT